MRFKPSGTGRYDQGFTLLEVMASLVLLGLLAAVFGMGLVSAMQSHEFSRANVRLTQKAQPAMARMARELMELTFIEDRSSGGQDPFILYHRATEGDATGVGRFGLHFNRDDNTVLLYTDFSDPSPLSAATTDKGDILVDGVSNLSFNYIARDDPWPGPGIDDQLLFSIEIILDLFRPEDASETDQFRTIVHLRNTRNFGGATPTTRPVSGTDYNCFISSIRTER